MHIEKMPKTCPITCHWEFILENTCIVLEREVYMQIIWKLKRCMYKCISTEENYQISQILINVQLSGNSAKLSFDPNLILASKG